MKQRLSRARSISVVVLTILSLLVLAVVWNVSGKPFEKPVAAGDPAPAFTLLDETSHSFSLDMWKGQVVVLNFGTTWCEDCRAEEPVLDGFYKDWKGKGVIVAKVDYRETPLAVQIYKTQRTLSMPVLLDRDGQVTTAAYQVVPFPTTIILDRQGVVRARIEKPVTRELLETDIRPLLGNKGEGL